MSDVSIALATYNGELFLADFFESLVGQTYKNFNIIIVDDHSSDNTLDIIIKYKKILNIEIYINDENIGYKKNFEKALFLCKSQFIFLADQDDVWVSNKVEYLLNEIGDNLLIHSDAYLINANGEIISYSYTKSAMKPVNEYNPLYYLTNGIVTGCTAMINSRLLEGALPFPDGKYVHDRWLGFYAALNHSIKYTDEKLVKYRQHDHNSVGANYNKNIFTRILSIINNKNYYEGIINNYAVSKIFFYRISSNINSSQKIIINDFIVIYNNLVSGTYKYRTVFLILKNIRFFYTGKNFLNKVAGVLNLIMLVLFNKK